MSEAAAVSAEQQAQQPPQPAVQSPPGATDGYIVDSPLTAATPTQQEWPNNADGYELCERIGHGAFAVVNKAKVKTGAKSGTDVAVKIIDLEQFADSSLEEIRRELQMMRMCRHENVIAYHVAFPAKRRMWLVMPLLSGGSCANVMRSRAKGGGFEDIRIIGYILRETAKALKYFHDNMQIHRDLKAGNILLGGEGKVFLSDFGVSAPLRDEKRRNTFVGTPCWMAPEVLEQSVGYDYKADVWSYGITAIELAYGEAPYQRLHPLKVMKCLIEKDPPKIDRRKFGETDPRSDALFVSLIDTCLQKVPGKRPTMDEIFDRNAKFFEKADVKPLLEILANLPALGSRIPPKPSWGGGDDEWGGSGGNDRMVSMEKRMELLKAQSWDFKLEDDDDDLGIGETEADNPDDDDLGIGETET